MNPTLTEVIAETIVAHTRKNVEGLCHCGHKGRLGTSFAIHQAEEVVKAWKEWL